jgi:hypothetical protein
MSEQAHPGSKEHEITETRGTHGEGPEKSYGQLLSEAQSEHAAEAPRLPEVQGAGHDIAERTQAVEEARATIDSIHRPDANEGKESTQDQQSSTPGSAHGVESHPARTIKDNREAHYNDLLHNERSPLGRFAIRLGHQVDRFTGYRLTRTSEEKDAKRTRWGDQIGRARGLARFSVRLAAEVDKSLGYRL